MFQIIVEMNIKSLTELQALALEQKREGKTDLAELLINRNPRGCDVDADVDVDCRCDANYMGD